MEVKLRKVKLSSYPLILDIVPTKACNLDCFFCIKYSTEGNAELSLGQFNFIAERLFPRAYEVYFCSGGEPFLNKNFMEFLEICGRYKVFINITSNGTLLTEGICQRLITNRYLKAFSFSFDGAKQETVEAIRRGIDYQKVIDNMRLMADLKKHYRRGLPLLNIRCAVMKKNINELPELIKLADKTGVDRVTINYLNVSKDQYKGESLYRQVQLVRENFYQASRIAKARHIQLVLPGLPQEKIKTRFCDSPWRFIKIDPDGSVRFCYGVWQLSVGNIFNTDKFLDLWNNEQYQLIRKTVNGKDPYFKHCLDCSVHCGYNEQGQYIYNSGQD